MGRGRAQEQEPRVRPSYRRQGRQEAVGEANRSAGALRELREVRALERGSMVREHTALAERT